MRDGYSWGGEEDQALRISSDTWKTDLEVWDVRWSLKGGKEFLKRKE